MLERKTLVETQTLAQDSAASRFQNRGLDNRIGQYRPGALWTAAISGIDPTIIDVHTVSAGHADAFAGAAKQVSD